MRPTVIPGICRCQNLVEIFDFLLGNFENRRYYFLSALKPFWLIIKLPTSGNQFEMAKKIKVRATSVKDVDQHEVVKQIAHFLKKSGKVKASP